MTDLCALACRFAKRSLFSRFWCLSSPLLCAGRLASTVAKELIAGQQVVVVRCEAVNISGNFYRNKLKFMAFLRKKHLTNPKRGQFHFRRPSKVFWRTVRGMLPHKSPRGQAALDRLKVNHLPTNPPQLLLPPSDTIASDVATLSTTLVGFITRARGP